MSPARTNVDQRNDSVRLPEELVSRQADHTREAEDPNERQQPHRHNPPDHVSLLDEIGVHFWLRLIQLRLNDCPDDGVYH